MTHHHEVPASTSSIPIIFTPAFSPASRYVLRDDDEVKYFRECGGAPEATLIQHAATMLAPDDIFIDVGAHIGTWSQHLARFCKRVIAFEPQKTTFERLVRGLNLAGLGNFSAIEYALGDRPGPSILRHVSVDGGGSTVVHRAELGRVLSFEQVNERLLDSLPARTGLSDPRQGRIGLIKIDVEGHELAVINGAVQTLEEHNWPPILAEAWLHDWYAFDRGKLIFRLQCLGYKVWPHALTSEMLMCERRAVTKGRPVVVGERHIHRDAALDDPPASAVEEISERSAEKADALQAKHGSDDMSVLLTLVMIVKNEEHGLEATLRSFLPYVDRAVFVDTGSTDGTKALIARVADEYLAATGEREAESHLCGWFTFDRPFEDFSQARNAALDLAAATYRSTFTIMPDADDRLTGGDELRAFLAGRQRDQGQDADHGGFMINMFWGGQVGDFYLPLVLRQSVGWRYKGVVHEYVDGGIPPVRLPAPIKISKHGNPKSSEATRARWERDQKLLAAEVVKNPNDPRSWFYLAQTLECLGLREGARTAYRKRVALGGFRDETFEALIRIARITRAIADHPDGKSALVTKDYLACHEFDPTRAEPLYDLADYHLGRKEWALAYLYGQRVLEFPLPASSMMVAREVYEWQNSRLVAIAAFYLAQSLPRPEDRIAIRATGKWAADLAVKARPDDMTDIANRAWFAESAAVLFGAVSQEIGWKPEAPYHASNPSIHYDGTRKVLRCILRTVNYSIVNGQYLTPDDNVIYTRNVMLTLDPVTLEITDRDTMEDLDQTPRTQYPVHGYEDCRLFQGHDGALLASATVCDFDPTGRGDREIVVVHINKDYNIYRATPLRGPWSAHAQKNWMPVLDEYGRVNVDEHSDRDFVYSVNPLQFLKCPRVWKHGFGPPPKDLPPWPAPPGRLRGGSQLISVPANIFSPAAHIALVHEVAFPGGNARMYLHRFIEVRDGKLYGMTQPFYFNQLGIEFAAGLALVTDREGSGGAYGARLVASYAVNDCAAFFATFDLARVRSMIEAI